MIYRQETVLADVTAALGETPELPMILNPEELPSLTINTLIMPILPEVAAEVMRNEPIQEMEDCIIPLRGTVETRGANSGIITLPSDYLRLVCFKMSGWSGSLTNIEPTTTLRAQLSWRIPEELHRMCTPEDPFLLLSSGIEGMQLEYYGIRREGSSEIEATYIAKPTWNHGFTETSISLPKRLYRKIIEETAKKIRENDRENYTGYT
ncbi:MAG: hypothetical protein NC097_04790 [Clostridium sp.]|nr:hypothetical protein [Clostridium sp.]